MAGFREPAPAMHGRGGAHIAAGGREEATGE